MKKLLNLKRLLGMRKNKGFTLVEVIISSALLGILVVGVVTFMTPVLSMIQSEQKSARAMMLAESIDTYISGSIRSAELVEVFTNVSLEEAQTVGMMNDSSGAKGNITIFMGAGENASIFEVRCIGVNWLEDSVSGRKKLMLTNCTVDNNFSGGYANQLTIKKVDKVFDDSMYNGLHPRITLETFKAQDASGAETSANARGYMVSSKVYLNPECYNVTSEAIREKTNVAFEGVSYIQCVNLRAPSSSPIRQMYNTQAAIDSHRGTNQYSDNGNYYYYPDMLIYYVVRL